MAVTAGSARPFVQTMQVVIAAILLAGLVARDPRLAVNALLALIGTFIPTLLARDYRVHIGAPATVWITAALCLHVVGMVGAYEAIFWWDHLTHLVSASLVAAIAYTVVTAADRHLEDLYLPGWSISVLLFAWTLGLGVFWEVMEFVGRAIAVELGTDPLLVQYGLEDTMLDLAVDGAGGLLIAILGPDRLEGVVRRLETRFFPAD
jgi:hypothetical protein